MKHSITFFIILISAPQIGYSDINDLNASRSNVLIEYIIDTAQANNTITEWHREFYHNYQQCLHAATPSDNATYSFFALKKLGMKREYLDYLAIEYAKVRTNTFLILLFTPASISPSLALETLSRYGIVVYKTAITCSSTGLYNLLNLIYEIHHCYGWLPSFDGIQNRFQNLLNIKNHQNVLLILWESDSLQKAIECKRKIRSLYDNKNNTVCHFTDKHREVLYLAKSLFNQNTIDFLNKVPPALFNQFIQLIKQFQKILEDNPNLQNLYCIDGGAVLSAYGLRDCNDLDIVLDSNKKIKLSHLGCNNQTRKNFGFNIKELIHNPRNFFFYKGLKFLTLDLVYTYKIKKASKKDLNDISLMQSLC